MNIFINKFKNFVKHSISDLIIIRDAILIMTCIVPYVYMFLCMYIFGHWTYIDIHCIHVGVTHESKNFYMYNSNDSNSRITPD